MIKKSKKVLAIVLSLVLLLGIASAFLLYILSLNKAPAHAIKPADSFNDNPLKGFVPFSSSYTNFPHSLEFFYIPVSALYPDPESKPDTQPDFTPLEEELEKIANRGNQAVFRLYLDYPTTDPDYRPVGIPRFLRNEPYNLKTYDYGEFNNFISRIPDYSNVHLRELIKTCIKAMGEKYDGDPRIGFITGGFLGFWGEWHCWPYNGIENPKNLEPSTEVFNEVITAYESAFKKTKIVLRYPVGDSQTKTSFGFHDDSYCYETIPASFGGDTWSFGEKLINSKPSAENRWQTAPVGGELRPEIQQTIFDQTPWSGAPDKPHEVWETNLNIIHPSWMINEAIKVYKDETKDKAIIAANQMGYDFRILNAYYKDEVKNGKKLYLAVDIQNIGVAPFYYDNTLWPVLVGLKKDGEIIEYWTTSWDLSLIPANREVSKLEWESEEKISMEDGYYTICIKAQNPLPNGNPLGFANEYMYDDGWLDLGVIAFGDVSTKTVPEQKPQPAHKPKETPASEIAAAAPKPNTYEAESSLNILGGGAKTEDGAMYSGGKKVGYVGNNDGTLLINNITAPADGEYVMEIYYATDEPRSVSISVNDGDTFVVDFEPGLTWTKMMVHEVKVSLKKGDNSILFFNETGWAPDLDKIYIVQ